MVYCTENLQGRGHHLSLAELIGTLALKDSFSKYMAYTNSMFHQLAQQALQLSNNQISLTKASAGDGIASTPITVTPVSLASIFCHTWDFMKLASKANFPAAGELNPECRFSDQRTLLQSAGGGGASVKPDGVFYYPSYPGSEFCSVHALLEAQPEPSLSAASPKVLGRIAGFAMSVWEAQPTRLFVPVFYMHGPDVSLVLFARSGYYCVTLGRLFHTSWDPTMDAVCDVEDTLRYLWFLLALPSDRFGHIVDVAVPATGLKFVKSRDSPFASVSTSSDGDGSELTCLQRIPQAVSLLDFQSYVFKTR
ncbi:hypothetical protein GGI21_005910, partial [Coemansia aciculifera]